MIDVQNVDIIADIADYKTVQQNIVKKNLEDIGIYKISYEIKKLKKPEIIAPETTTISPVIKYCVEQLKASPKEQNTCLNLMLKGIENDKTAPQFLDFGILDGLFYIVNEDISKFQSPTFIQKRLRKQLSLGKKLSQKDIDKAYKLSDKEIAQRNKVLAIALIAKLQNVLYKELSLRSGLKPSFYDMPAVPQLIDTSKNNPDDDVKALAIGALYSMYRPEFKKDLVDIMQNASKSNINQIKIFAQKALEEISKK
ncbi:hypothetical protein IJG14_09110 [bacterium]|nr:hypothetical protein [bacterium]